MVSDKMADSLDYNYAAQCLVPEASCTAVDVLGLTSTPALRWQMFMLPDLLGGCNPLYWEPSEHQTSDIFPGTDIFNCKY
jgi:hypothetical protein